MHGNLDSMSKTSEPLVKTLPRVSVVIASYNYGRYLSDCIESALSQQGIDLEVVLVDDASSDSSPQIAAKYAALDSRVSVTVHDQNHGHISTFNECLNRATGDYIVKLDSDDMLTPGALARAAAVMVAHPVVGLVYGNPLKFTDSAPERLRTEQTGVTVWRGQDWIARRCQAATNCIMQPEAMVRASVLRRTGGHREHIPATHDLNLWLRIAAISDVARVRGCDQGLYRFHADSLLRSRWGDLISDLVERRRAFRDFFDTYDGTVHLDLPKLSSTVSSSLAKEALGHACRAIDRGRFDAATVDGYVRFTVETFPQAATLPAWRSLQRRLRVGPELAHRRLRFRAREVVRDVEDRIRWRRWRYTGL